MESELTRRVRFSSETVNDLIFWAIHFFVVAIALAIVWTKIDSTNRTLLKLIDAQNRELGLVQEQTTAAKREVLAAESARISAAEVARKTEEVLKTVINNQQEVGATVLKNTEILVARVQEIQASVLATLNQIKTLTQQTVGKALKSELNAVEAQKQANVAENVAHIAKVKAVQTRQALVGKKRQLKRATQYINEQRQRNVVQRLLNTQ